MGDTTEVKRVTSQRRLDGGRVAARAILSRLQTNTSVGLRVWEEPDRGIEVSTASFSFFFFSWELQNIYTVRS